MTESVEEVMTILESACLKAFEQTLLTTRTVAQPQVHMFTDGVTYPTDPQPLREGYLIDLTQP